MSRLFARFRNSKPLSAGTLAGIGVFLCFGIVGLYMLLECPPLWRDYDGLIQINSPPSDMTIVQYPVAYPLFSRLHIFAAAIVEGWLSHTKTVIHLRKSVVLNDAGIHALMVTQQIALALSLTSFVRATARRWPAQLFAVLLLVSNASIFISAQLISTEALSEILLVFLAAVGLNLFLDERPWRCSAAIFAGLLYVSILTRHANAVFAGLLPLAWLLAGGLSCIRTGRFEAGPWKRAALFIALGLACIFAANGTTRLLCGVFEITYRSISARGTSERLGFVERMSPEEKAAFLAGLQAQTSDPVIKEAIPRLARSAPWVEQRAEIETLLRERSPALAGQALDVEADADLDLIAKMYFRTGNRHLLATTAESIWRGLARTTPADVAHYYLKVADFSLDLYPTKPFLAKWTRDLAVCGPAAKARIVAFKANPWVKLWKWAPNGALLLAAFVGAVLRLVRKIGDPAPALYALTLVIIAFVATCLALVIVAYQTRFTSTADLFAFLALAILGSTWLNARFAKPKAGKVPEDDRAPPDPAVSI